MLLTLRGEARPNPIWYSPPQVFISELTFNGSANWSLELEMFIPAGDSNLLNPAVFDSIVVSTRSGSCRLVTFPISLCQLFVVTPASFSNQLIINPDQDTVTVTTYLNPAIYIYGPVVNSHQLIYGYTGCEIPLIGAGQSVSVRERTCGEPLYFYLDDSPTIGAANDTTGATISVFGYLYDYRDSLVTGTPDQYAFAFPVNVEPNWVTGYTYHLPLFAFTFDSLGNYHTRLLSRSTLIHDLKYLFFAYCPYGAPYYRVVDCVDTSFFMQPGNVLQWNIHLTDTSFIVVIPTDPVKPPLVLSVVCSPNPVNDRGTFFISSETPAEEAQILIYNLQGKLCRKFDILPCLKSRVDFTKDQLGGAGMYIFSVMEKGQKVGSGQILVQ